MSEIETDKIVKELETKDPEAAKEFLALLDEMRTRAHRRKPHITCALSPRDILYDPREDFHG